jgi:hypothetical protein
MMRLQKILLQSQWTENCAHLLLNTDSYKIFIALEPFMQDFLQVRLKWGR